MENESNPKSNISGGNNTTDRVFILSHGEAVKYFNADINASQENPYDYQVLFDSDKICRDQRIGNQKFNAYDPAWSKYVHIGSEQ